MSKKYSRTLAPLTVDLTPSRWLHGLYIAAVLIALAAVGATSVSWPQQFALALLMLGIAWHSFPRERFIRLQFDGDWRGVEAGGEVPLQLADAVVWPMLIVLRFSNSPSTRRFWRGSLAVVLLPDSVGHDQWRRLRLFLTQVDVYRAAD